MVKKDVVKLQRQCNEVLDELKATPQVAMKPMDAEWIVAVEWDGCGYSDQFTAVGVLVAPEWVLTCAHPFKLKRRKSSRDKSGKRRRAPKMADKTFHARIGGSHLGEGEVHAQSEVVTNNFRPATLRRPVNDVALMQLTEPSSRKPLRIADYGARAGDRVSVLGWPNGPAGDGVLTQVDTVILPPDCAGGLVTPGELCAANVSTSPMVMGYAGGPVVLAPDGEDPVLVGLASRGHNKWVTKGVSLPWALTDVVAHRLFIQKTINAR